MKKDYKISVAGTYYHQKALKSLQTEENYDYSLSKAEMFAEGLDTDDRIYQYGIEKCLLDIKHEPGNQYGRTDGRHQRPPPTYSTFSPSSRNILISVN